MSTNKYKIIWEKWKDPFGEDPEDRLVVQEEEENRYEEEEDESIPNDLLKVTSKEIKCKIIITPFGAIPYTENTASSKIFNFWTGHANFSITKNIADLIEETDGVETLDVFTRYRFRISVGKAFQDSVVMRSINNQIYSFLQG